MMKTALAALKVKVSSNEESEDSDDEEDDNS